MEKRRFIAVTAAVTAPSLSSGSGAVMLGVLGLLGILGLLGVLELLGLCPGEFGKHKGSESITQQRPSCKSVRAFMLNG